MILWILLIAHLNFIIEIKLTETCLMLLWMNSKKDMESGFGRRRIGRFGGYSPWVDLWDDNRRDDYGYDDF